MLLAVIYDNQDNDISHDFQIMALNLCLRTIETEEISEECDIVRIFHVTDSAAEIVENLAEIKCKAILVYLGHGEENSWINKKDNNKIIFDVNNIIYLTNVNIIYSIACSSLKGLGRRFIEKNGDCSAYFGYSEEFWPGDEELERSEILKVASSGLLKMINENATTEEATKGIREEYEKLIRRVIKDKKFGEKLLIRFSKADILTYNMRIFDRLGSGQIRIEGRKCKSKIN